MARIPADAMGGIDGAVDSSSRVVAKKKERKKSASSEGDTRVVIITRIFRNSITNPGSSTRIAKLEELSIPCINLSLLARLRYSPA